MTYMYIISLVKCLPTHRYQSRTLSVIHQKVAVWGGGAVRRISVVRRRRVFDARLNDFYTRDPDARTTGSAAAASRRLAARLPPPPATTVHNP